MGVSKRGKRGQRRHPPYTLYSIGNLSRVIFKTTDPTGINRQSNSANVSRVDDPCLEPRVLHESTQNEMAEDSESDITIRFVEENDYREISANDESAKQKL